MTFALPPRALALAAAAATLAVAFVTLPATPLAPASSALADSPACTTPIADYPNVHGQVYASPWGFYGVDPEVGVYIAGNWDVTPGAAEAEGTIVVGGDATFDSGTYFNLGTVGLGSQVNAAALTDMLTTGGEIAVASTTTLDVGNHRGGDILAGGSITPALPSAKFELNGGTATPGAVAPLAPHASVAAYYQSLSSTFAALPVGTTTVDLTTDPSEVRFIGDGVSSRQVFTVSGASLGTDASQKGIAFSGIPANAVIVVNVTGATAEMSAWGFSMNGSALDFSAAEPNRVFSGWTQSIAWNFPTATAVSLGLNGQLPGSVLIPTTGSDLDLRTSINGRLYVNGDVTFGGAGTTGLEIHNYPLRADCAVATGSFTIGKTVSDPDAVTLATRDYTGTYECVDSLGALVDGGTWALEAGETATITGLPVGTQCAVAEDTATLAGDPSATDPTYTWGTPTYSAASVTVSGSFPVQLTVTNVVLHDVGSLSIAKTLTDPDAVVAPARTFTGTYTCSDSTPAVVASGSWSLAGGASTTVGGIPSGALCSIAENASTLTAAPSADPSYHWGTPTYSSSGVTITTGATAAITVTNVVERGLGDLEMIKILDDPYDVVDASRVYTGTWSCTSGAVVIESGIWSTTAGAAPLTLATDLPAGTTCTLAEDAATLAAPPLAGFPQYIWRSPVISPATVTIADGVVHRFTVTNTVFDPIGDLGDLAHAGTDSTGWIVLGGGVIAGGILLVHFARRRRLA